MSIAEKSIEVEVPVRAVYNQWTQFESFPQFMKGVESVEQIDETSLHFRTSVAGIKREFDAQVLEQSPDQCIAWVSKDKPRHAGKVTFENLGRDLCRVSVELEWEPEGLVERTGAAAHVDEQQVSADLLRFKEFIESRGIETGAWRGEIHAEEVVKR